jgi:hypothetical protein
MLNWKSWAGRTLSVLMVACWTWLITKQPIPVPLTKPILAGVIVGIVLIASYLRTHTSFWVKWSFMSAIALLIGLLTHFGVTVQLWNLFVLTVLLVFLPEHERRPWWPAMKRTVARFHEDPDGEEKRLAEMLGRRGA